MPWHVGGRVGWRRSLRVTWGGATYIADLGGSSYYSRDHVPLEGRSGVGFHANTCCAWVSRSLDMGETCLLTSLGCGWEGCLVTNPPPTGVTCYACHISWGLVHLAANLPCRHTPTSCRKGIWLRFHNQCVVDWVTPLCLCHRWACHTIWPPKAVCVWQG